MTLAEKLAIFSIVIGVGTLTFAVLWPPFHLFLEAIGFYDSLEQFDDEKEEVQ